MKTDTCRLCKVGKLSEPLLNFGNTPLANEFLENSDGQETFPLQVCACESCQHYQLSEAVSPERMFRHYLYVAGTSPVNVRHFDDYAKLVVDKFKLSQTSRVLDIASNDGTLLKAFKRFGMTVLGIDPARNLAEKANSEGIETIPEFFTNSYADIIVSNYGKFDLVTANNVFAHVPDLEDFAKGVKKVLAANGVFSFEVSYFLDVCNKALFDTVYHEHTSYHTISPLVPFFDRLGMKLFDVQYIPNHGGSIRCFVTHSDNDTYKVNVDTSKERDMEYRVRELARDVRILGLELRETLGNIKWVGKSIAIYGTPAKATTLMYALGISPRFIDFAVDDNPLKQGKCLPGTTITVYPAKQIYDSKPDFLLVLAWNFADSIIQNCKINGYKGKFIVPLPQMKVV